MTARIIVSRTQVLGLGYGFMPLGGKIRLEPGAPPTLPKPVPNIPRENPAQ